MHRNVLLMLLPNDIGVEQREADGHRLENHRNKTEQVNPSWAAESGTHPNSSTDPISSAVQHSEVSVSNCNTRSSLVHASPAPTRHTEAIHIHAHCEQQKQMHGVSLKHWKN